MWLTNSISLDKFRAYFLGLRNGTLAPKLEEIFANRKTIAEGYYTTKAIYNIVQGLEIDTPILTSVYDILYNKANPLDQANLLLSRPIRDSEFY